MIADDAWGVVARPAVVHHPDARFVRGVRRVDAPALLAPDVEVTPLAAPSWWRLVVHTVAVFVVVLGAFLALLAVGPMALGYRPVAVASGSMEPSLRAGDVVLSDASGGVDVGTIIVYESTGGSRIHRVVEVTGEGFRTKGDANPSVDSAVVPRADVRGTGVMLVPFVGLPRQWLAQRRWLPLAVATITFGACLALSRRDFLGSTRAPRRRTASA